MKISKSKQELARIISENDGWIAGGFAAQQDDGEIWFSATKPIWKNRCGTFDMGYEGHFTIGHLIANRHHTILSRDEYFHLYPALGELCGKVTEENRHEQVWTNPPTIEQLAADYRNAKDCAERKQLEADAAKVDADAKLKALDLAGEAIGLLVSPITKKQEPELVIKVQVGGEVECIKPNVNPGKYMGRIGTVSSIDVDDTSTPYLVDFGGKAKIWCHEVKFIRRPQQQGDSMCLPKCQHLDGNRCEKLNAKCLERRIIGGCVVCPFRGYVGPVRPPTPKPIPSRPPRKP